MHSPTGWSFMFTFFKINEASNPKNIPSIKLKLDKYINSKTIVNS